MRNKAKAGKPAKGDGIVRRELASVLTNGTVVDEAFLTEEEASHCVAIKEGRSEDGSRATYGVCVLDAATGQFELSSWEDDNVATRLETLTRQLRIKELLHEKVGLHDPSCAHLESSYSRTLPTTAAGQSHDLDVASLAQFSAHEHDLGLVATCDRIPLIRRDCRKVERLFR